ncbi:MAG: Filamentation induced by cAMP protein Fic [Candidatus Magasanikbacteria bacterium GW2011_GWC2_37_14]|uniref:Filamentation induced by cAMP protein Fic n=1 Tax=Candidatus Magasanikbacteria bacterium GW2011_GWC2_37_14 TaxID=1619046 RepID=A0A0G0JHC1_9BACT|nr:MAG: Filamentation induced by cAMP protein Fic [Candidatus Magasanikbacteria bacterium GW2011_GWC2_37_14]
MLQIEQKKVNNKPFFYLSEQIPLGNKYKKIQVYLGKNIPNNFELFYKKLQTKETKLVIDNIKKIFVTEKNIPLEQITEIEKLKIKWKYLILSLSSFQQEQLWRKIAIQFIYESNAIEGSKLSPTEVEAIIRKKYLNKNIDRKEIIEVENSIKAFALIRNPKFELNQRTIIKLHSIVTNELKVTKGYKKVKIIVNNKETTPPGQVRPQMSQLLNFWHKQKKLNRHPLFIAANFHQQFESIHPFEDGNGRVGRLLFNWMLLRLSYPPILFRFQNRLTYFSALNQADDGRPKKWYWHCLRVYKNTLKNLV